MDYMLISCSRCSSNLLFAHLQIFFGINSCWKNTKTFGEILRCVFLKSISLLSAKSFLYAKEKMNRFGLVTVTTSSRVSVTFVPFTEVTASKWQCHYLLSFMQSPQFNCTMLMLLYCSILLWYVMVYSMLHWIVLSVSLLYALRKKYVY